MKLNKYLKIFVVCFCLVALLTVSCFATSAQATNVVYGHYISPGEYVFVDVLDFSVFAEGTYLFKFSFKGVLSDETEHIFEGLRFNISSSSFLAYYLSSYPSGGGVYNSGGNGWTLQESRYITVLDGFYIYDSLFYQWWQSNTIRVSSGYSSNFFDSILSIFTGIGQWISGASANLVSMFYANEALTFVGTLSIAALAMAVSLLLFSFISRFLRFRG